MTQHSAEYADFIRRDQADDRPSATEVDAMVAEAQEADDWDADQVAETERQMAVALEITNVALIRYLMRLERQVDRLEQQIDRQNEHIHRLQDRLSRGRL